MEKKNNSGMLVGILIGLVIALLVVGGLFATGTIKFKITTTSDNGQNQVNNTASYKIGDYIATEKVDIGDETINVEKVVFKNLDSSLTQKFTEEQTNMIESAKSTYNYFKDRYNNENLSGYYIEGTKYLVKSNIWYQINKNVLTVYSELKEVGEIGTGTTIAVLNIDLTNKKVLSNEELLKLVGSSFKDIATKEYNRILDECTKQTEKDYCYYNKSEKKVTLEEHKNNKENFINNIEKKLDDLIKVYIQDGKVKYDYNIGIRLVNEYLAMGGPFPYETTEIGAYN